MNIKKNLDEVYTGKKLLITGGTGSFGKAVLKRFKMSPFSEIIVLSRDEKKQDDLRKTINDNRVRFVIGDVREYESIIRHFFHVDFVFHAAALKQVPSCELYPSEAFRTNVIGSENVIKASIASNVSKCILLSTDKAVYPINAMGISKSMMEKIVQGYSRESFASGTTISCTRYGNVMCSRGSVIPLFLSQIRQRKPLTITDPKMTRFLMSLSDSVSLVDHAFHNSESGDIFVMKSPASTVYNLAKAICELEQVEFNYNEIGTRHSEKLYETLVSREEMTRAIDQGGFFRIPSDNRNINYEEYTVVGNTKVSSSVDFTSHNCKQLELEEIKFLLQSIKYKQIS